ncbi:MAG: hypothetical protein HQL22_00670 [Candidatus Omnitrophica bacterium]|nr:hypothetical protein [Candidatus Omnitrophota bacterium]
MAVTDIIAIIFLVIMAANGTYQGFMRSLAGPVSFLLGLGLGCGYYLLSHDFRGGWIIGIITPFLICWLINRILRERFNPYVDPQLSLLSRLSGQLLSLSWGIIVVGALVGFLSFFPFEKFELENAGRDVQRSATLALIKPILAKKNLLPSSPPTKSCLNDMCSMSEEDNKTLSSQDEIQTVINDPRVQKLINDPAAVQAIKDRNFTAIMSNPTIKELEKDPGFIAKVLKAYPKIQGQINEARERKGLPGAGF